MAFIVDYSGKINSEKTFEKTKEKVDRIVNYMHDHFKFRRAHKMGYLSWITFNSAFPSVLYSLTKLFFITNVIIQVNLVCKFLDVDSWTWGFDVSWASFWYKLNDTDNKSMSFFYFQLLGKFIHPTPRAPEFSSFSDKQRFAAILTDGSYNRFQYFPILVGCEYQLQESVSNFVNHKAQCIIPMNVINEKIFIGLYFWLLVVRFFSYWPRFSRIFSAHRALGNWNC